MYSTLKKISITAFGFGLLASGCVSDDTDPAPINTDNNPSSTGSNDSSSSPVSAILAQSSWENCDTDTDFPATIDGTVRPVIDWAPYKAPENIEAESSSDANSKQGVILGGTDVERSTQFPWMSHLNIIMTDGVNEFLFKCGGSLIDENWIMTAAHCVSVAESEASLSRAFGRAVDLDFVKVEVGLGGLNTGTVTRHESTKALCHTGYDTPQRLNNDIALVRLDSPVDISSANIGLATLPSQGTDILNTHPTDFTTVPIGWGLTESGQGSAKLLKVLLSVDRQSADQYEFRATASNPANGNQSICMGDSGGPTHIGVGADDGTGIVLGLSSYVQSPSGSSCNFPNVPSVFTRISSYRNAVDSAVAHCTTGNSCL